MKDLNNWAVIDVPSETEVHPKELQYMPDQVRREKMRLVPRHQWQEFLKKMRELAQLKAELFRNEVPMVLYAVDIDTTVDPPQLGDVRR